MQVTLLSRVAAATAGVVLSALALASCSNDDRIWDIYPVLAFVEVVDAEGSNLLDSSVADNVADNDFYMVYEGEEYHLVSDDMAEPLDSRDYLPWFYGLTIRNIARYTENPCLVLAFGEFDGAESYDKTMTLVWPEQRRSYEIRIVNRFKWKRGKPDIDRHFYLDGKEIESLPFVIERP